jgi:hypothetical protein
MISGSCSILTWKKPIQLKIMFLMEQKLSFQNWFLERERVCVIQVPHSQRSLRENPKILPNFRSKNNTLRETF